VLLGSMNGPDARKISNVGLADNLLAAEDKITECSALIPSKEKSLVVDDGAAESAAVLIALDAIGSGGRGKEILGVERGIAIEFEGVSVEIICAGLGDDIDDAARVRSVFRAVVAGLHAEFLERIGERKRLIDVGVFVNVVAAVELVANRILPSAICGEGDGAREGLRRAWSAPPLGELTAPATSSVSWAALRH